MYEWYLKNQKLLDAEFEELLSFVGKGAYRNTHTTTLNS